MNKFKKLIPAFFALLFVVSEAAAQTDSVSINGYTDGAEYIVKTQVRTPITPRGCKQTDPISFTFHKYESKSPINPSEVFIDYPTQAFNYTGWRAVIGTDTIYTTSPYQAPEDAAAVFQSIEYKLTCKSKVTNQVVTKTVTLVTSRNNAFTPKFDGSQPRYIKCGNPNTYAGYLISILVGKTLSNDLVYKKPLDGSYSNSLAASGRGFSYQELTDGNVQEGIYSFHYNFLSYYDGTSIVSGGSSDDAQLYVQRKSGSPLVGNNINRGVSVLVNNNPTPLVTANVCESDNVRLNWELWDVYYPTYSQNYNFVWKRDVQGVPIEIGRNTNKFKIDPKTQQAGNYWLSFEPINGSLGCPTTDAISNASPMKITAITYEPVKISGDANVCPDGNITLAVNPSATAYGFSWTDASNAVLGTSTSLIVNKAGTYTIKFKDSSVFNVNGEECVLPTSSKVVTSFNKPVLPTITSTGKKEYCDYTTISDVLSASTTWTEASIVKWEWTANATKTGAVVSSDNSKYNVVDFGSYSVRYQDANGCFSNRSSNFVIAALPRPATPTITRVGNAFNCKRDANGNVVAVRFDLSSAAVSGNTYQWYSGGSLVQNSTSTSLANITSDATVALEQTDGVTGCKSLRSTSLDVAFQANPSLGNISITKSAYTLKAVGFEGLPSGAEYVWKAAGVLTSNNTATQKIISTSAADYTVARYATYTLNGQTIKCLSNSTPYQYAPDPEFSGIIVWPNPAASNLNLDVLDVASWTGATLNVYDMQGRVILTRIIASYPLQITDLGLSNGLYVLNLNNSTGNVFQTKLVINK